MQSKAGVQFFTANVAAFELAEQLGRSWNSTEIHGAKDGLFMEIKSRGYPTNL